MKHSSSPATQASNRKLAAWAAFLLVWLAPLAAMAAADLIVANLTVTPPTGVNQGQNFTVRFRIRNIGDVSATATTRLYHSTNTNINTGDTYLNYQRTDTLAAGAQTPLLTITVTAPTSVAGNGFIGVFADYNRQVTENSESNNTANAAFRINGPDLRISELVVTAPNPATVAQGGRVTIRYRIINSGQVAAANVRTRFYFSTNSGISTSLDTYLNHERTVTLAAGAQSPQYTVALTLPANAAVGVRYIGGYADYDRQYRENSESNNTRSAAITVTGRPDLLLNILSISPATITPGGQVTITYRIRNDGGAAATNFKTRFYYSSNNTYNTSDTYLNHERTEAALAAGSNTTTYTAQVTVPSSITSSGFILGFADYDAKVAEGDENNNVLATPINITTNANRPDLQIDVLSISPTSVRPGATFTLRYRIFNAGGAAATNVKTRFYHSTNSFISTTDTYLNHERTLTLAAGARSTTYSVTVTLPSNISPGNSFIGGLADYDTQITEVNESNNSNNTPITVTAPPRPDLRISALSIAPTSVAQGATFTLTYQIHNAGQATATGAVVRFYHSTNTFISTSDTYLNHERTLTLSAGSFSQTFSVTVQMPGSVNAGAGHIGALADYNTQIAEINESNNTRSTPVTVVGRPDLIFHLLSISPTTIAPGGQVTITYRIRNQGDATARNFTTRFYYSTNSNITTTDTYLNHERVIASLAPNANSANFTQRVTIPANITRSGFIGGFVDTNRTVTEGDETNNTRSNSISITTTPNRPDLQVSFLIASPSNPNVNDSITVRYRIYNAGATTATNFKTRFYFSTDTNITTGDRYLNAEVTTASLAAGATTTSTTMSIQLPRSVVGAGYIGAITDYDTQVSETHETNNTRSTPINVVPTSQPDLQLDVLSISPTTVAPGATFTLRYRIYNAGFSTARNFTTRFYHSTNSFISTGDTYLNHERVITTLNANARTTTYSVTVTLPSSVATGNGFIGAIVDSSSAVSESNEGNNTPSVPITVPTPPRPDYTPATLTVTPTTQTRGNTISVAYKIDNKGTAVGNNVSVRIYHSTNSGITTFDTPLDTFTIATIAVNGSSSGTRTITLPSNLPTGAAYIGIFVDWDTKQTELSEGNNTRSTRFTVSPGPQPDWSAETLSITPTTQGRGGKIIVSYKIDNKGTAVGNNVSVRIYYSTNTTITTLDTTLDTFTIATLAAGGSSSGTRTITLPATLRLGAGFIGIFVDWDTKQTEVSESNNTKATAITVTTTPVEVTPEPQPEPRPEPRPEPVVDAGPDATPEVTPDANCYTTGCKSGEVCKEGKCIVDPCANINCQSGEFCRKGVCVKACDCTKCPSGELCIDGTCKADPCNSVTCNAGEVCDPTGKCIKDPCAGVTCGTKRVCDPTGKCVDDPCNNVTCGANQECKNGQCVGTNCGERITEPSEGGENPSDATADGGEVSGDTTADKTADAVADATADSTADSTADTTTDAVADAVADKVADAVTDTTADAVADKVADAVADAVADNTSTADQTGGNDKTGGNDNVADSPDTGTPAGGCCQVGDPDRSPLFYLLLVFICLFTVARRPRRS